MLTLPVNAGIMEKILTEGLVVLTPEETRPLGIRNYEGELMRLEEVSDGEPTGRAFFARGMHDLGAGYVQVTLQAFMEDVNPETGKPDRMPMTGDFANEKITVPVSDVAGPMNLPVKGEKPLWIYRGVKWVAEYSISRLFFSSKQAAEVQENKPAAPGLIYLKVQGQGGEVEYAYRNIGVAFKPAEVDTGKLD